MGGFADQIRIFVECWYSLLWHDIFTIFMDRIFHVKLLGYAANVALTLLSRVGRDGCVGQDLGTGVRQSFLKLGTFHGNPLSKTFLMLLMAFMIWSWLLALAPHWVNWELQVTWLH